MNEDSSYFEEKINSILEQLQEQQKINKSIMTILTQILFKDLLNDYGKEINKLITKIEYSNLIENLETYFKEYKIFIETSSILDSNIEKFLNNAIPFIEKYKNKIFLPYKVIRDIELNKNNYESLKINKIFKNKSIFDIREEKEDETAMVGDIIKKVFIKHKNNYKLILITKNEILRKEILELNKNLPEENNEIKILKITKEGFLEE